MRPSFRLSDVTPASASMAVRHPRDDEADIVCELSPMQSTHPPLPHSLPVEDRLLQYGRLYDEKLKKAQALQQQAAAAAEAEVGRPSSPLHPRRLFAPTPSLHASAEVSRRHRADRLSAYLAERDAERTEHPAILPASREMAAAVRRRERWEGMSVGERLHSRQRVHDERVEAMRQEEAEKFSFKPAVSEHTRRLKVAAPVVERLYASRHPNAAKDCAVLGDVTNRHHPSNNSPKPTSTSAATYNRLYHDAVSRRTQSETQHKLTQVRDSTGFKPTINPVSHLIASQSAETTQARLLRAKPAPDEARHVNPEDTFTPRVNSDAAAHRLLPTSLSTRGELWLQRRRDRLRHVVAERVEAEMRECTFHPRTNRGPVSGSPWGMTDEGNDDDTATDLTLRCSSADIIKSTEELLNHIDLDELTLHENGATHQSPSRRWADVLSSTVSDDILELLEEVESVSCGSRRPIPS
jgi:hypothetical protein